MEKNSIDEQISNNQKSINEDNINNNNINAILNENENNINDNKTTNEDIDNNNNNLEIKEKNYYSDVELEFANKFLITNNNYYELISFWNLKLSNHKSEFVKTINKNSDIEDYNYDFSNLKYKIIKNDINRTRTKEKKDFPDFNDNLRKLLIFYCENNNIKYHQGMNEIMSIFLFMKEYDKKIELYQVYNIFTLFIDYFFCNYFYEKDINCFNSSCHLLDLLLKYHMPIIYKRFYDCFINSEIYSSSWFFTGFSNKCSVEVSIYFFNIFINFLDKAILFFFIIGTFKYYENKIYHLENYQVIEVITKINICDLNLAKNIFINAFNVKKNTPYSIYYLIDLLHIFKPNSSFLKFQDEKLNLHYFNAFPIFPIEVLYNSFNNILTCPNITCKNFQNAYKQNEFPNNESCYYCKMNEIFNSFNSENNTNQNNNDNINLKNNNELFNNEIDYCIFDLRIINKKKENQIGILPKLKLLENINLIKDNNIEDKIYEELLELRKKSNKPIHIMLLTNSTKYYSFFENKLYYNPMGEKEKFKIKVGLSWQKQKIFNKSEMNKYIKNNKEVNLDIIKEYDNFRKIINKLKNKNFPYVSFVYGGYYEIHYLSKILNLPLISHDSKLCYLCQKINNKKKTILISEKNFNLLNENKNNLIFQCNYNKNKNATLIFSNKQLMIFTPDIKEKKIFFKLCHQINRMNLISFNLGKNKRNFKNPKNKNMKDETSFVFLYSKNKSQTDLVQINLDLLDVINFVKFIKACKQYEII